MTDPVDSRQLTEAALRARSNRSVFESRILVVDDDPMACRLLATILKKHQFPNVVAAEGGVAALRLVDEYRPDLVLLDMQMPDLSGLEVCERIRRRPELVDLPILMQTATVDRKEMGTLFMAGASDFLSKPINPAELMARVAVHLERRNLMRELREYRGRTSQELEAARCMQAELLPTPYQQQELAGTSGLRIGSFAQPSSEIGGDIWGLLPINPDSFGIFLADFTGHGVNAALNTFRLHALIHEYRTLHNDPVALVSMLNERLSRLLTLGQFATFLYMIIDHKADRLRFVSAGAPPPIITEGLHGPSRIVEAAGVPLGVSRGVQYELCETSFAAESTLLVYSDGLPEFPDDYGDRIGEEGLLEALVKSHPGLTPHETIDRLCRAAGIGPGSALPDDTTIICVDRRGMTSAKSCRDCMFIEAAPQLVPRVDETSAKTPPLSAANGR